MSSLPSFAAPQTPPLNNRVAAITGSNKGIGFFIALHLATSGLFQSIILACRDETRGQRAVDDIRTRLLALPNSNTNKAANIHYLPLTVGDTDSHQNFYNEVNHQYGKLDVLINNAGFAFKGADPTPFRQQCKPTLDINFRGTVDFTETMLPLLRKGVDARIVNVASMAGRLGQLRSRELKSKFTSPSLTLGELRGLVDQFEHDVQNGTHDQNGWGSSNYGLSKLALIAATKVMAREEMAINSGVKINCCCPGYCDTDMTSHKGHRDPSEGAMNAVIPATMTDCPSGEYFSDFRISEW